MRAIWQGTDSYLLVSTKRLNLREKYYAYKMRTFARICDKFASEHYAIGELVERNLRMFGLKKPIKQFRTPVSKRLKIERDTFPDRFIILYYYPKGSKFRAWLYGYDLYQEARERFRGDKRVIFLTVKGKSDMRYIYPLVDFMIRPNRHDGYPRMVTECEMNGIPYYWSAEKPNFHKMITEIRREYNNKFVK
jgi:hypothetical protein